MLSLFQSCKGVYRVRAVLLVIGVLAMVAFLGTGKPDTITGFQLYHEGNECSTQLAKYDITCASPLADMVAVCQTTTMLQMCGTKQGCMAVALDACK